MRCPHCQHELERLAGLDDYHGCPSCLGAWLTNEAAHALVTMRTPLEVRSTPVFEAEELRPTSSARHEGGPYRRPEAVKRRCPVCEAALAEVTHRAVTLDICFEHGTFFDRGELRTLARRIKFHTAEQAAQRAATERATVAECDDVIRAHVRAKTRDLPMDLERAFLASLGK